MLTGQEYQASLRDGRRVYFQGRLVGDLESEPALAAPLAAIAGNYDKYYSVAPGAVNPVLTAPRSQAELRDRIPVLMELDLALNVTYQSLMTLLVAAPKVAAVAPEIAPVTRAARLSRTAASPSQDAAACGMSPQCPVAAPPAPGGNRAPKRRLATSPEFARRRLRVVLLIGRESSAN